MENDKNNEDNKEEPNIKNIKSSAILNDNKNTTTTESNNINENNDIIENIKINEKLEINEDKNNKEPNSNDKNNIKNNENNIIKKNEESNIITNEINEQNSINKKENDNKISKEAPSSSMISFFEQFKEPEQNNKDKTENIIKEDEAKEEKNEKKEESQNKEENEIIEEEKKENIYINITEDEGIKKKILKKGEGGNPKEGNTVVINYIGKYQDKIFDQSNENDSFSFTLGENKVIKGWEIAVKTMKLGEKAEFIMTSEYTYGDKQVNEDIPPKSTLTFEIELKGINYKSTEDSLENLTYEEKLQWGKLLKKNGVDKFKENDIQGARECFVKALSFLRYMSPQKEEEKEGIDLFLAILSNICNCYNKEKDYDSVFKFATIGINIRPTQKLLYFRTIASAYLEGVESAEKDLNELINLFSANNEQNSEEVEQTINYLKSIIEIRKKIYLEKNKKYSRAIFRQIYYNNKSIKHEIILPRKIPNINNPFVFLEIKINDEIIGKIEIELFRDIVPITVENFRLLCNGTENGLTYKNSEFTKLIKDFGLYGGELQNNKDKDKCIYGEYFDDENYTYCHCRRGLLTMDNDGKNKNNSKFIITLKYIPWFDGKHVVFGQIIKGLEILNQIEDIETDNDDKPLKKIMIINCGEILDKNMEDYKDIKEDIKEINEINEDNKNEENNDKDIKENNNDINIKNEEIENKQNNNDIIIKNNKDKGDNITNEKHINNEK